MGEGDGGGGGGGGGAGAESQEAALLINRWSTLLQKQQVHTQHTGYVGLATVTCSRQRSGEGATGCWTQGRNSDKGVVHGCVLTLAETLIQAHLLVSQARRHYEFVASYGRYVIEAKKSPEECIADRLEDVIALTTFARKIRRVTAHVYGQMRALRSCGLSETKTVRLDYPISRLGDALSVSAALDCLVNDSPLASHWSDYRKSAESTMRSPNGVDSVLDSIEETIVGDKIFEDCLDAISRFEPVGRAERNERPMDDDVSSFLRTKIGELEKFGMDVYESSSVFEWIKINCLFILHNHLFGNVDRRLFKMLTDANAKAHSVSLTGRALWYPDRFLLRHAGVLCSSAKRMPENYLKIRQAYVATKKLNLPGEVVLARFHAAKWALKMNEAFEDDENRSNSSRMNHRMTLLARGVRFASQINFIVRTLSGIHAARGMPMTKSCLLAICKLIEILKGMRECFSKNSIGISSSADMICQHISFRLASEIASLKRNIITGKNYSKRVDELTILVMAERAFKSPSNVCRDIIANLAISMVSVKDLNEEKWGKISGLLNDLESIADIETKMKEMCDCSFLYWNKEMIPIYFNNVYTVERDFGRLQLFFLAIGDCYNLVKSQDLLSKNFYEDINAYFTDCILKPLSHHIETNLRLQSHSHLQLDISNPFLVPVSNNHSLLRVPYIRFAGDYMSIKHSIEHYLSYTFYNLTTVVLHDWKTYGQMRQLADFKFQLKAVEDTLPTQTLEQGLDVLEIMRNIQVFVSKFSYNLNNQIFIEEGGNNKHLNTINIRHVANSIRTHGIGIMNTTINFTYQFLRKKFHIFSQFMYDEQIKARLIKDVRHFKEASANSRIYSFKRAEKFNRGICNLGMNENGESYLDLFRTLITHIGNAMGYVRMVRSGGLHCCANATVFLPSLELEQIFGNSDSESFQENSTLMQANNMLRNTIESLTSNFSHGTDYFKLLVDVFVPAFRNEDNMHLKTFYIIVPPLTVNYIEHMLLGKDKMNKKNKSGASFTDDGFAMGLAFILKLLSQEEDMDSLHWFQSVNDYIAQERKSLETQLAKGSVQLQQALALTDKKLTLLEEEFQLLYFSFSSARIFFQ